MIDTETLEDEDISGGRKGHYRYCSLSPSRTHDFFLPEPESPRFCGDGSTYYYSYVIINSCYNISLRFRVSGCRREFNYKIVFGRTTITVVEFVMGSEGQVVSLCK